MPTSLFRPKSTLSFLGHIHLDSRCASWKHNWSTTCWLQCFAWNRTRHGWRITMCLVWQTELCQALNLHWVEESQVQKCDYSGVILVSIWTRAGHEFGLVVHSRLQVVCSCITNWRRLFDPRCGLHISLACALIFKLLICPIDWSLVSKQQETIAESSCGHVILEAATMAHVLPLPNRDQWDN